MSLGLQGWVDSAPGRRTAVLLGLFAVIDLQLALALGLVPLDSAGGLHCGAWLRGADPKPAAHLSPLIVGHQRQLCTNAANSQRALVFIVVLIVLALGVGAVLGTASALERYLFNRGD